MKRTIGPNGNVILLEDEILGDNKIQDWYKDYYYDNGFYPIGFSLSLYDMAATGFSDNVRY